MELRKPIDLLFTEKNEIDKKLTTLQDQFNVKHEKLTALRQEQFHCREGKEQLSASNMNKPAKRVFDKRIVELQIEIEAVSKELEEVEKQRVVVTSLRKGIEKSIKELQNS